MNWFPLVSRELRVASRHKGTYWLRVLFTMVAIAVVGTLFAFEHRSLHSAARAMWIGLAVVALIFTQFYGVVSTADCISSEKRNGTLGLLFLTPLRGLDVVLGKMASQSLVALTCLVGLIPVFFLPLLLGGITLWETVRLAIALVMAYAVSVSLGLLVSTLVTDSRKAVLTTLALLILVNGLPVLLMLVLVAPHSGPIKWPHAFYLLPMSTPVFSILLPQEGFIARESSGPYFGQLVIFGLLSLGMLGAASLMMPRVWQVGSESAGKPGKRVRKQRHRRRSSWKALGARDPVAWLTGRQFREGFWFRLFLGFLVLVFLGFYLRGLVGRNSDMPFGALLVLGFALHTLVKFIMCLDATRTFADGRNDGSLELLFSTSLSDAGILRSHYQGLSWPFQKRVFLLAGINVLLLLSISAFRRSFGLGSGDVGPFTVLFVGGLLILFVDLYAIRWIGMERAVTSKSHLAATLKTAALVQLIPLAGFGICLAIFERGIRSPQGAMVVFVIWYLLCAGYEILLARLARGTLMHGFRRLVAGG